MAGSEPSDAIRVVNALLTQIDQIKRYLTPSPVCSEHLGNQTSLFTVRCANVIILTTSNITGAIDLAFVDRLDLFSSWNKLVTVCIPPPTGQILNNTLGYQHPQLFSRSTTRVLRSLLE